MFVTKDTKMVDPVEVAAEQIIRDTEKIVDNIVLGDCPIEIERVFIFVQNTNDITAKESVKILCNYISPIVETADALLLERLCTMNGSLNLGMGDDLAEIMNSGKYSNPEAAVPAIVDLALKAGWATVEDVERLRVKFRIWLKKTTWEDCSEDVLKKGEKYPWDYHNYLYTKSLYDGVLGTNMTIVFENDHPVDIVGEDHLDLFQELWSKDSGRCENVEYSVVTAMQTAFEFNAHINNRLARAYTKAQAGRSSKQQKKKGFLSWLTG